MDTPDLMTVTEVANFLRMRQRTVYELVRTKRIPTCKLSGKLLFPKRLIELWVAQSANAPIASGPLAAPPPIVAGSHDPLLEWAMQESNCGLAMLVVGSTEGLLRLLSLEAIACGVHLIDPSTGQYNAAEVVKSLPGLDFVTVEWAQRQQGLLVARGNPLQIRSVSDLRNRSARVVVRQEGSGSASLLAKLVSDANLSLEDMNIVGRAVNSEIDVATAIRHGQADAGLAIEAAARLQGLDFIPLRWERFDLIVRRFEYFEAPLQALFAFARTAPFRERAASLGGYAVANTGGVVFNGSR
jgi:putative molybdopterin biosynthesis protein